MLVFIKGAGDLATGIAVRLFMAGYTCCMSDIAVPTSVRRSVAFSRAIYENEAIVEGIRGVFAGSGEEFSRIIRSGGIPIFLAEEKRRVCVETPDVVVDAIIAKKNTGTTMDEAKLVIGVGPGFEAGVDCHAVVETKRGHNLGRVIDKGSAIPNTGVPGMINGYTTERIIRAHAEGPIVPKAEIGDFVYKGQVMALSGGVPMYAQISGILRGMLQEGVDVTPGMKCGDIDARGEKEHCFSVSDKSRAIGGGVLEAINRFEHGWDLRKAVTVS